MTPITHEALVAAGWNQDPADPQTYYRGGLQLTILFNMPGPARVTRITRRYVDSMEALGTEVSDLAAK